MMRNRGVNLTKNFSVKNAWLACVALSVGLISALAGILRAQNTINTACDTYYKEFVPQMSQKDEHRDYLKYACSVIPAKVVLAYTSDISKDGQRIEKERREFSSSVNLGALSAGQNGVNLGCDEFSRQNGVNSRNGEFSKQNSVSQRTNDESGISWGEVFNLIADLATIAQFALKF